jgi:hypothetical protein
MINSETRHGAAIISRRLMISGWTAASAMAPAILKSVFASDRNDLKMEAKDGGISTMDLENS